MANLEYVAIRKRCVAVVFKRQTDRPDSQRDAANTVQEPKVSPISDRVPQKSLQVGILAVFSLLIGCSPQDGIRFVPQFVRGTPRHVAFHPKKPNILLVVEGEDIAIWDIVQKTRPIKLRTIQFCAHDACFSPEGDVVALAGHDSTIRLWNLDGTPRGQPFEGHKGAVYAVAFSPKGDLIASAGADGTIRLWNLDGTPRGQPLRGHEKTVYAVAFSPKGDLIASTGQDGTVRLWNQDGTPRGQPLKGHERPVGAVAFSPKGDLIASAGGDETVWLWSLDGTPRGHLTGHQGTVHAVEFSPRGHYIASAGDDGTIRLWNLDGTPRGRPLRGHEGTVSAVAFSPQGDLIASAGDVRTVRLWNLDGTPRGEPISSHEDGVNAVAFSPQGNLIASAGGDGTVCLWNLDGTLNSEPLEAHNGMVLALAFSPQGDFIASAGEDGTVILWNLDEDWGFESLEGHEGMVRAVAFSPQGDLVVSAGDDGTVRLWNLDGTSRGEPISSHQESVYAVAFSPKGDLIASAGFDGTIRLWNVDGTPRGEPISSHQECVNAVAFSPEGNLIASAGDDDTVRLWNLDGTPCGDPLRGHEDVVHAVAFSPHGDLIASVAEDATVRLWNRDGTPRGQPLRGYEDVLCAVAFSPRGDLIASAGSFGTIRLWNLDGTPCGEPLKGPEESVRGVAFSAHGDLIATAGEDATVRLWNPDGTPRGQPLEGHEGRVEAVAFSPEGDLIASAGHDGTVRLWSLDGTARGQPLKGHEETVTAVAFSPRGDLIASAGWDGTIRLWNLDGTARGQPLKGHERMVSAVAFSRRGDLIASAGWDGTVRLWSVSSGVEVARLVEHASSVGFYKKSIWVSSWSGLLFADLKLHPKANMILTPNGGVVCTTDGWYFGDGPITDKVKLFRKDRALSKNEAYRRFSRVEVLAAVTGERHLSRRLWAALVRTWHLVWGLYGTLPVWVKPLVWVAFAYVVVLVVWLLRPHWLAVWSMPDSTASVQPQWRALAQIVSLMRFLGGSQRSLDAWLKRHKEILSDPRFQSGNYVGLGNESDVESWQGTLGSKDFVGCWITGRGGSGKTTLAIEMGRLAQSQRKLLLSILIDEDWSGSLIDRISQSAEMNSRRPTIPMIRRLISAGRILVIVDGASERQVASVEEQIATLVQRKTRARLIVTSRSTPKRSTFQQFRQIDVGPLTKEKLPDFVEHYAKDESTHILEKLEAWIEQGEITALFAFLAIDRLGNGQDIETTFPELVLDYVRAQSKGSIRKDDFIRAAQIVGYLCVKNPDEKPIFLDNPGEVEVTVARYELRRQGESLPFLAGTDEIPAAGVLDDVVNSGLMALNRRKDRLKFVHDPIAEYLAAWHLHRSQNKDDLARAWKSIKALQRANPDAVHGLAEALKRVSEIDTSAPTE